MVKFVKPRFGKRALLWLRERATYPVRSSLWALQSLAGFTAGHKLTFKVKLKRSKTKKQRKTKRSVKTTARVMTTQGSQTKAMVAASSQTDPIIFRIKEEPSDDVFDMNLGGRLPFFAPKQN